MTIEVMHLRAYRALQVPYCHVWWRVGETFYSSHVRPDHFFLFVGQNHVITHDNPHPGYISLDVQDAKHKEMLDAVVNQLKERNLLAQATEELKAKILAESAVVHDAAIRAAVAKYATEVRDVLTAIAAGKPHPVGMAERVLHLIEEMIPEKADDKAVLAAACLT